MSTETVGAVLVCGAGIAGIQASLDLADSGFKVYLLDSAPAIGGRMAQLDRTFPAGDCALCILSPRLVECARNRNIEIITLADIQDVSGGPGSYKVRIRQNPRYVDLKKCDACGDCAAVCPVDLVDDFNGGLGKRKAIYRLYPQAIPNVFGISKAETPASCRKSCPAGINVQGAIALTSAGKLREAYDLIRQRCPLPAVCGRVCRHPCEDSCRRNEIDEALSIREIEKFIADNVYTNPDQYPPWLPSESRSDTRIAVIGSGPAGLTAAADLALNGYGVTVFEAQPLSGGMLRYGIPEFRLPKDILDREIQQILKLGVEVKTDVAISKPKELLKTTIRPGGNSEAGDRFDAVLIATGAWVDRKLGIPGEDAEGVWECSKFLYEINSGRMPEMGPNVVVLGSDDRALDAARCALRLPGVRSVSVACLESRAEMPARSWEAAEAVEEGVVFHYSLGPTKIEASGEKAASVTFRACTSVFDEYKKFDPLFDDTGISSLPADSIIIASGRRADSARLGVEARPGGCVRVDPADLATGIEGVFAAGDAVLGPSSAADAIAQGHKAAEAIDAYIRGTAYIRSAGNSAPRQASIKDRPAYAGLARRFAPTISRQARVRIPRPAVAERLRGFKEIDPGYTREQAADEARRCLSCGQCSECMQCVKACTAGAVRHDQSATEFNVEVGSIILASGVEEFQASLLKEFGGGRYANVLSAMQFERMLAADGPTGGCVLRPSDHGDAKRIAFIQCAGKDNGACGGNYCSSVCCMSAVKEATAAIDHAQNGKLEISIFGMNLRAYGKEFDSAVNRARDEYGIHFIREAFLQLVESPDTKNLFVCCQDRNGKTQQHEFDLVVLNSGLQVPSGVKTMAGRLGIELDKSGFARTNRLSPLATSRSGIYVAGAFQEPKDIAESAVQASAAASCAMEQLTAVRGTLIQRHEYPWERDVSDEAPRIGVFICRCGRNIASVIDVERIVREAAGMPNVYHAEANMYACSEASQQHIKTTIERLRLNRLVVASCRSRIHEVLFQEMLRECGLNPYLFVMTNIRDQCSWVHKDDRPAATNKAIDLVAMAIARARHLKALRNGEIPVTDSALILGGGLAGMTAALNLAGQGYKVHLVEKKAELGGLLRNIHRTLEEADVPAFLAELISKVQFRPEITLYLNATLTGISGQVGNFRSTLKVADLESIIDHGVVIVATGGQEHPAGQFLYGTNRNVKTQIELEKMLNNEGFSAALKNKDNPTVVMIQCVGSRDEKHPYCSRVCCSEAIKNALALKNRFPRANVVIVGRDIRIHGFREAYYREACEQGVRFVRRPDNEGPEVIEEGGKIGVNVFDTTAGCNLVLHPDLLVLSNGIVPASDNAALSGMLRSALNSDGFFMEAHPKLRPVDLSSEGIFICGLAHSPRFIDETIAQAQAAAGRAARILSKAELEIPGQVARVNPAACVACATCVKICPYGAPVINALKKSEIRGAKCMGCGSCAAACPSKTISLQHQESLAVTAMLDELLVGGGYA